MSLPGDVHKAFWNGHGGPRCTRCRAIILPISARKVHFKQVHFDVYYKYVQIRMRYRINTGVEQLKQLMRHVGCFLGDQAESSRKCLDCTTPHYFNTRTQLLAHYKRHHASKFAVFRERYQTLHARFHSLCSDSCYGPCFGIDTDVHLRLFR